MESIAGMRVFARTVEAGSFSAAGRQIGAAPSSVSRQVAELEAALGARLFHRTTRKLSLTEAGEVYYAHALKILNDIDEARLAVARPDGAPSGVLRMTIPDGIARELIAVAIADFVRDHPAVRVVLSLTDEVVDIVGGGFDLAIRFGRPGDSSLKARKIGESRRIVCASPDYLARAGTPEKPSDLTEHNCLTFRAHPGHNLWAFRGADGVTQVRATGDVFALSATALVAAAVAGLGVVLLPDWTCGAELRAGTLVPLLADHRAVPATTPIHALYPPAPRPPPKVRAMIDFLVERFRDASGERPRR